MATRLAIAGLWFGIAVCLVSGNYGLFNDTASYEITQVGQISFTGDSYRAWPVPLLFGISSSYRVQTIIQALLYGAGWSAVLWTFTRRWDRRVSRFGAAAIVLIALSPLYLQWTMAILSEAITMGFLLLGVAAAQAGYALLGRSSVPSRRLWLLFATMAVTMGMAAMNRAPLILIFLGISCVIATRAWPVIGPSNTVVFLSGVALATAYVFWLNHRIDQFWQPISRASQYYVYLTRTDEGKPGELADHLHQYIAKKAPICLSPIRAKSGGPDPGEAARLISEVCPEGGAWLEENFTRTYSRFLATNPGYSFQYLAYYFPQVGYMGLTNDGYVGVSSVIPAPFGELVATVRADRASQQAGHTTYAPIVLWLAIGVGATCADAHIRRRRMNKETDSFDIVTVAMAGSLLAVCMTLFALNNESARITSQPSALMLACACLAVGNLANTMLGHNDQIPKRGD